MSAVVVVLGGYGGFGARLSRRLSEDGWRVLVAGRDVAKAARVASNLAGAEPVFADRNGDLSRLLAERRPLILIDAAGPFQGSDRRVPEACIAHGVHYVDLADARDFVCGIGALDGRARAAGVVVVAGASSVPALSGAVAAELAAGLDAVGSVEISIAASNRAAAGASVAAAILSYVGRPVRLWSGRAWRDGTGWGMLRRETYVIGGRRTLRRWVALADVPDHEILPDRLPGRPATLFRAGPGSAVQLFGLWLLSWPVRRRWVASLEPLNPWLAFAQRLTAGRDDGRSAMAVEVKGTGPGGSVVRRWTLIAEDGCGPEIPTLAAQLLARDIRSGAAEPGARHAGGLLKLASFDELFGPLPIERETTSRPYEPLYRRVLGDGFDLLPEPVRAMHDVVGDGGAVGVAEVTRGRSRLARLVAAAVGFPPEGTHRVHVAFSESDGTERWTRSFSGRRFSSELSRRGDRVVERFGPLRFAFRLPCDADGLTMVMTGWTAFGVPLPLSLAPRSLATERADGDDFVFDVPIALPLIGPVIRYHGRLRRA